jgi:hypothetical protein
VPTIDTGYGSAEFLRACAIAPALRDVAGRGPMATWGRLRAGSLRLSAYQRRLPVVDVRLSDSPAGRVIGEHLAIREAGRWRYRGAQGVLPLPAEFADYLRGRSRQAVRTNIGHARREQVTVISEALDNWAPGDGDSRIDHISPGPAERWAVISEDDRFLAEAIVSIDREVALLQGMASWTTYARWLLHTAIVERLCGSCDVLLTNSDDAYFMDAGNRHFQRLLGYRISRLRVTVAAPRGAEPEPPEPACTTWPPGEMTWR